MKRRTALQLLKNAWRRDMPPPVRIFRDRRRVERAHRQRYGSDA